VVRGKGMYQELQTPEEPKQILKIVKTLSSQQSDIIDWSSTYIWSGNQLPLYLWDSWRNDLTRKGLSWQDFLRIIKSRNYEAILWTHGKLSWSEYASEIVNAIYGPLGQTLSNKKKTLERKYFHGKIIELTLNEEYDIALELPHQPGDASLSFRFNSMFMEYVNKNVRICIQEIYDN